MSSERILRPRVAIPAKPSNELRDPESDEEFVPRSSLKYRKPWKPVVTATCWISDIPEQLVRLVAGVKRYVPGVFGKEQRELIRVFSLSATGTCAVLSDDDGITLVSSTGRVVMVPAAIVSTVPINAVHDSEFKIPNGELKSRFIAHLNTKPRLFQGERQEYSCEVSGSSVTKNHLFAEP